MSKVLCKNCVHFREAPYSANITGCWHPDHMRVRQTDPVLDQQQIPGDHKRINLRSNCSTFEADPNRGGWFRRLLKRLAKSSSASAEAPVPTD